jgi:GWxTD domain-containing protein
MMRRVLIASWRMLVCLTILGSSNCVMAQRRMPGSPRVEEISAKVPRAEFDVLAFRGPSADSTRMDLYIAVPYESLEFLYAVDKYVADYSVSIAVTDKERLLLDRYESYNVLETTTEHQNRIQGHEAAPPMMRADAEQISFLMAPGKEYELRISIRDFSSRREFDTTIDFYAKNFPASSPGISDLMNYRERTGMRIVPLIGPDVSALTGNTDNHGVMRDHGESGVFAELYNLPTDSTIGMVAEVIQDKNNENPAEVAPSLRVTSFIRTAHGILSKSGPVTQGFTAPPEMSKDISVVPETPLFIPLPFDELWSGRYLVRIFLLPGIEDTGISDLMMLGKHALLGAERSIVVRIARGIPSSLSDLDQAIDQLHIIATGDEWDSLSNAKTAKEKRDAIIEFWNQKNASVRDPGNTIQSMNSIVGDAYHADGGNHPRDVFYARVEYANAHFGTGFQSATSSGWKSDRGRVYIALGPPDYIDSHPASSSSAMVETMQKPYEIWEYTGLNARYTFVDEYMLDDYRLRGSFPPPGTFIWER